MTEPAVRRIVIACDAACDIRVAVADAAALAERWNAALHGVFFEDENLYRLAALPFGRQTTLSSTVSESFGIADIESLSSALGAAMRRALAEAAAQRGLDWSFRVVRDLPTVAALAGIEGDMLIVQGATRPFSGSWRPRSAWDSPAGDYARTILIRRQRRTGPGTVAVLWTTAANQERLLVAGVALAEPGDEFVVLVQAGAPSDIDAARPTAEAPAARSGAVIRSEVAPIGMPALLRRLERLTPALIVLDAGEADRPGVRDVIAGTRCDVLLVR